MVILINIRDHCKLPIPFIIIPIPMTLMEFQGHISVRKVKVQIVFTPCKFLSSLFKLCMFILDLSHRYNVIVAATSTGARQNRSCCIYNFPTQYAHCHWCPFFLLPPFIRRAASFISWAVSFISWAVPMTVPAQGAGVIVSEPLLK